MKVRTAAITNKVETTLIKVVFIDTPRAIRNTVRSIKKPGPSRVRKVCPQRSQVNPQSPIMPQPCTWHLALAPMQGRGFVANCVAQTHRGSDQPANKNAGGHPPALGESPNWKTQFDYSIAPCELLEALLPELLEEVLLKVAESAKERHISLSLQMPLELQVGQLDSANVVCNLGKTIAACNGILIDNRLTGDARCNRPMNRFGHNALPAVACRDIKNAGETPGSWRTSYSEDPITLYHEPER